MAGKPVPERVLQHFGKKNPFEIDSESTKIDSKKGRPPASEAKKRQTPPKVGKKPQSPTPLSQSTEPSASFMGEKEGEGKS
jgi:hypothetical protein